MMRAVNKSSQSGAIAIIMVFIVMVVITGMLVTVLSLSSSTLSDGTQQNFQLKSNYLTESALEQVEFELSSATACEDIFVPGPIKTIDSGSFQIVDIATDPLDANECLVEVKGTSNGLVSYFDTTVNLGGGGAGSGTFTEPFPDNTDFSNNWTDTPTGKKNQGYTQWDAANDDGAGSTGGSIVMYARSLKKPEQYVGYATRLLKDSGGNPITLDATSADINLTYSFGLMSSDHTGSGSSSPTQEVTILLSDSTGTYNDFELWTSKNTTAIDNLAQWSSLGPTPILVDSGEIYDSLKVEFSIKTRKNENTYIFLDDINLSW